jgi:hypothetical protein
MQGTPSRHKPLGVSARMKQTRLSSLRNLCVCILYIASFLAIFFGNPIPAALAQKLQQQVIITRIDPSTFPVVQVYAILRDRRGKPIPTGRLEGLTLTERVFDQEEVVSDDLHQFTMSSISSGAEVLFVIDAASDLTKPGASRESYLVEMQNGIKSFTDSMQPGDKAGILVVAGSQVDYLQPLTAEKELLNQGLAKIPQNAGRISFGRYGIDRALNELLMSPDKQTIAQAVVFMTPQLFHGDEGLDEIVTKALEAGIPIHSVLTRDIEYSEASEPLQEMASQTGGVYAHYKDSTSLQPIYAALNEQRAQILMTFRSKIGDSSERTLDLDLKDVSGTYKSTGIYQVSLQPPVITILSPQPNAEIVRQADSADANMALVEPVRLPVTASITWADGFPREIASAQLKVDGSPASSSFSENPDGLSFEWDLRTYQEPGTHLANLGVQVQDELGLISTSEEDAVTIRVSIPELIPASTLTPQAVPASIELIPTPAPTVNPDACSSLAGSKAAVCRTAALGKALVSTPSGWFAIGGLLIAIFAIFMAFHYRGPISQAGGKALGAMQETVTQLKRPPQKDSGVYLLVLRGDAEMVGKSLPLSPDHTTILGRSLREAELTFQVNQEHSVVSRKHCEIQEEKGRYRIIDLGSTHGTFVNSSRLPVGGIGKTLTGSDQIALGPADQGGVLLEFRTARSKAETKIESPDSRPTYFGSQ